MALTKRDRAAKYAPALEFYRGLSSEEKGSLSPLIGRGVDTHLQVLEALESGASYWEIAEEVGLALNTVKQITYGFEDAGIIVVHSSQRCQRAGRPRIFNKRK